MNKADVIDKFSEHLFWDIRTGAIDMEKNAPYVIQRVLEYGRLSDWKLLLSYYGMHRIADISCHLRTLEPRALSFISTVSGVPKNQFRCFIMKP